MIAFSGCGYPLHTIVHIQIFQTNPSTLPAPHKIDPVNAGAPTQADIQALSAMLNAGQHEKAIAQTRLLIARFPQVPLLHFIQGLALKDHPELAIASYRSALALKPDFFDALNNLGSSLFMLGRHAEAVDSFEAADKIQPGNRDLQNSLRRAYSELAQSLMREHRLEEAVDIYRRLLVLEPHNPKVLSNFGGMLVKLGQFEEASKVLTRAMEGGLQVMPQFAFLAVSERGLGRPYDHLLARILELEPKDWKETGTKIWAVLALGRSEEAFAFKSDRLNVMSYGDLRALYKSDDLSARLRRLPELVGRRPRSSERPLVYAAADGVYAGTFADELIASVLSTSPGCDVHLHLMNPGGYDPNEALRRFPSDRVSWSSEVVGPCDKTLYSTRRFVRLAEFLAQADRLCVAVDMDAIFNADLGSRLATLPSFDALVYRSSNEIAAHQAINAGFVAIAPSANGRDFINFLAGYILHFEDRGVAQWFVDQLGLLAADTWFRNNVPEARIETAPAHVMDWKADHSPDALIWHYKGAQKEKAAGRST